MKSARALELISKSLFRRYSCDVRVRFAPSPTGRLHLGGLRTALYNFLFARANDGKFLIRIEDTDQTRIVPGAAEALETDLLWAGIKADESPSQGGSYGPYVQSQRLKHYREKTDLLIDNGTAYRCFCTDKRLELLRRDAARRGAVPRYDNRCRDLAPDEVKEKLGEGKSFCVRFKLEAGPDGFQDMVYGKIVLDTASIEGDPVILKTDGFPTYHLACVVDDHLMKISHVLRGLEWQISTSKHLQLYRAFGWNPPQFGHFPLLMNLNGTKLSKRQGDINIEHFRKIGVYPEVLLSFITAFGGGFLREKGKCDVFNMQDLIKQFNFSSLTTTSCKVDLEGLVRLNRSELDRKLKDPESLKDLCEQLRRIVVQHHGESFQNNSSALSDERLTYILRWGLPRMSRLEDFCKNDLNYIWIQPSLDIFMNIVKKLPREFLDVLEIVKSHVERSSEEGAVCVADTVKDISQSVNVSYGTSMKALRAALTGLKAGPPVGELLEILGKEESASRLQLALEEFRKNMDVPENEE